LPRGRICADIGIESNIKPNSASSGAAVLDTNDSSPGDMAGKNSHFTQ
jgi:hypothetical protein